MSRADETPSLVDDPARGKQQLIVSWNASVIAILSRRRAARKKESNRCYENANR